nr:MAG TPA: G protein pathway suppressor 2, SMRT, TBL1, co-repressor, TRANSCRIPTION [Caudoviricetes sp.]
MSLEEIKQQIAALTPPEYQEVWSFVVNEEYERRNADRYTAKMVGEMQDKG